MKIRHVLIVMLALLGIMCFGGAASADSNFDISDGWLYGYYGYDAYVEIPSEVHSISSYAFDYCYEVEFITIPSSVTYIGPGAFDDCNLKAIYCYGNSYAQEYCVENKIPRVILDANVLSATATPHVGAGLYADVVVKTDANIGYIAYWWSDKYDDYNYYTETIGDYTYWYYSFKHDDPGFYTYTFSGDTYNNEDWSSTVSFQVHDEADYEVKSCTWYDDIVCAGVPTSFQVVTGQYADRIELNWSVNDEYVVFKTWYADSDSYVSNGNRIWNLSYTFEDAGSYYVWLDCFLDGNGADFFSHDLTVYEPSYDLQYVAFNSDVYAKNTNAAITAVTGPHAKYLKMYTEGGSLVKTWNADGNSSLSSDGATRIWNVSYSFGGTGARSLQFRSAMNDSMISSVMNAPVLITSGTSYQVISAAFETDAVAKNTPVNITVKTGGDAKYLKMYTSDGSLIKTWNAADYSYISGVQRIWNVSYSFSGGGNRTMVFKGSPNNSTVGASKSASIVVTGGNSINVTSASANKTYITKGTSVTFTVKSGADARFLTMYSESGALVKTWTAASASKISGNDRVWTVTTSIGTPGNRKLTFKASKDKTVYGTGKVVNLPVTSGADYDVTSASFASTSVKKGSAVTITVKTELDAKYLTMFSENGSSIKTWSAANYSTVSGNSRVWTISYTFSGVGNRTMTFKASINGSTYGAAKSASISVTSNLDYKVYSAAFGSDVGNTGKAISITVKTGVDANYLRMYSETGATAYTWNASGNSTVSGSYRIWNVNYTFGGAGNRTLTFKGSADKSAFCSGMTASVKITTGQQYSVVYAAFKADLAGVGDPVGITVKTGIDAQYVTMYSGSTYVKTWSASGNSTISGEYRVWNLTYSFSGSGSRTLTFKASVDKSTYCSGMKDTIYIAE